MRQQSTNAHEPWREICETRAISISKVGVILFSRNLESVEQMVDLTNKLQACSPHSPLLISIDQEGGRVSRLPKGFTIFPSCSLLGRSNSAELAYAAGATIAKELRAVGVNMNMAPVLDVNS